MYMRLTDRARKTLMLANQEALHFAHERIGTEHILLGLIAERSGIAANALASFNVQLHEVRKQVERIMPRGEQVDASAKLPQSPRAALVIGHAMAESREFGHNYVGTEHLLLGVLREKESVAAQVLIEMNVNLNELRREVLSLIGREEAYDIKIVEGLDGATEAVSAAKHVEPPAAALAPKVYRNDDLTNAEYTAMLRVIDASLNRAAEGLRVVEDYVRFMLDEPVLTEEAKTLRHDLAAAISDFDLDELLAARDTRGDVGVQIKTEAESTRVDPQAVLHANVHRAAQALRSLGEYSKIIAPEAAQSFETIRYRAYQLETTIAASRAGAARLEGARLYVLVDGRDSQESFTSFVDGLLTAGVHAIQLRDKILSDREVVSRGRALRERITRFGARTLFILNDRPDLAVLCDADGVHVGQEELTVADARKIVGPRKLVGVSTHSLDQARQAVLDGANYIGVGPTFPSATKEFAEFPGVALLKDVAAATRLPAFAIGGITLDNLDRVLATGIGRAAVSGAIASAADPAEAVRKWLARLESKTP